MKTQLNLNKIIDIKSYFKFYLIALGVFAIFWLYIKHEVGNDSTISEWIINYQGGFTRRGLPGEIAFHVAQILNLKLRFIIFIFQSVTYVAYLYLIYQFFKNFRYNLILIFALFTPIFLIYHLAELEVLARKELFMFIGMLWFYNVSKKNDGVINSILWVIFILPIVSILYEPAAFYYSFFAAVLIIKFRNENLLKIILILILCFIPSLIASWFSAFHLLSEEGFQLMKNSLLNNFGENCYMSCGLMGSKKEALVHINHTIMKLKEGNYTIYTYLFRYLMIVIVGFFPLYLIIKNSKLNINIFNFKKILIPFLILNIAVPLHWLMFLDWGRAVNITYVSSVLFLFYLIKNEYIKINFGKIDKKLNYIFENFSNLIFFVSKKKIILFVFIIYSFGWSPPTLLSADVNSFPGYRIPYKTVKMIVHIYKTD